MSKRAEFSPKTKVLACIRYNPELAEYAEGLTNEKAKALIPFLLSQMTCPGLVELHIQCGRSLADGAEFDHIMRNEIKPDNSVANCRPLCPPACHKIKTAKDAWEAAKGRNTRRETKKAQRRAAMKGKHFTTGAKIESRNTLSKEERDKARQWKQRVSG